MNTYKPTRAKYTRICFTMLCTFVELIQKLILLSLWHNLG
jgi:hypothetical protein